MPHHRSILRVPGVILVFGILASNSTAQMKGYFPKPVPDDTAQDVSIVQLIAEPQKYNGKRVRLVGFVRIEFEGNAIYLHREDFQFGITKNGLWVDIPRDMTKQQQEAVNMHYVICAGVFQASNHGHMGMYSGAIEDVGRLQVWADQPDSSGKMPLPPR